MPLYNEQRTVATKDLTRYERSHRVDINYPLGGAPTLTFQTSWVERDNDTGTDVQQEFKRLLVENYNPSTMINMRDLDGNIVGQLSHAQLFSALYGMFFDVAEREDGGI